jgi:D-3-phosphoglycerate dehydrogenase / 2-oxoglutarate reductase
VNGVALITDCDMGDAALEREVLERAGFSVAEAAARDEDDVIAAVAETRAIGLLVQYAPITRRVLTACPGVRALVRYGVGLDNIDVAAAAERGVAVSNVPHYGTDEVADHAITLLLSVLRGVPWWSASTARGEWPARGAHPDPAELKRQVLGLVGFGAIARGVARRAQAFGMRVLASDPYLGDDDFSALGVQRTSWEYLWRESTAISLHPPLTDSTRGCVDAAALGLLPAGAVLVNTARAGLVDRRALEASLAAGHLGAFGTDVWWDEPPRLGDELIRRPRVLATPHVAWLSPGSVVRLRREAAVLLRDALLTGNAAAARG